MADSKAIPIALGLFGLVMLILIGRAIALALAPAEKKDRHRRK